jgi:glycopeptide antibiotics resistance protein
VAAGKGVFRAEVRKFFFRLAVKMLSSSFITFAVVFVAAGATGLAIELAPWITRTGVTDIDPLPLLAFSLFSALVAVYLRIRIMKRFSHIRP